MAITIPAALKRDRLLQSALRAFKNRINPILAFATKFEDQPLEGTDIVRVPYYSLATGASTDFVPANGYNVVQAQTVGTRAVTVNRRKYRMLDVTSVEVNRQPYLDVEKAIGLEAEKLADDVLSDVFSVVTAANYGTTTLAAMAATAFDVDDALLLRRLCSEANWPAAGRSLVLDSTFAEYLLRDARVGNANYDSPDAVREGRVPRVAGFDVREVPLLPLNGAEKIAGMAAMPSALAFATAPIRPAATLTSTVLDYKIVTDSDTGLSLEYRRFGDAKMDTVFELIECNYGYAALESAALKRITIP